MEKRYRFLSGLTLCLLFCLFPAATARADSSWRWAAEEPVAWPALPPPPGGGAIRRQPQAE